MPTSRFLATAAALGAVTALIVTFPLPLELRSGFLDDGSYDAYQFAWNLWSVRENLAHLQLNPFFTRYIYYPDGVPLLFHTYSFSLGLLSLPLQAVFGLVAAHNLLVVAAPALTLLVVGLLAREVSGDPWAALAGGLAAAVNPIAVWFLPDLYLDCTYLLAALLFAWWWMHAHRRLAGLAAVLVLLATLVFASQEFAVMALALILLDTVWRLFAPRRVSVGTTWRGATIAFWLLAALGLGALARVAASVPASGPPPLQLFFGSGYGAGLVTPPWLVPPPVPFLTILYLGTVPLLCLPAALLWGGRRAGYWLVALLATALMALGPYLHFQPPPAGLHDLPTVSRPTGIPGPYFLAMKVVPFLEFFRAPYRWLVAAQVALGVLTALGAAGLRARIADLRARTALTAGLLALVAAGAALDTRGLRAALTSAAVPPAYDVIRRDPDRAAIIDLPAGFLAHGFALLSSRYMYYQTTHRKFLLDGTVARLPPDRRPLVQRPLSDFRLLPYVKYVVLHRDLLDAAHPAGRRQAERVEGQLQAQATIVFEDPAVTVYRLATFRPETVR